MSALRLCLVAALGIGLGAAVTGSPAAAVAQQADVPPVLSLSEALALAERHSPDYRRALSAVRAAEAQRRQTLGAFLPSVSASLYSAGSSALQRVGVDEFGRPVPDAERQSSTASQNLGLNLTLFEGGSRFAERRAATAAEVAAEAEAEAALLAVRGAVARQYYAAAWAERKAELEARLLASAQERLEATERLLTVGSRDPMDVLGARVELSLQEQAVADAIATAEKQRLALVAAIGMGGAADLRLADRDLPVFDPSGLDIDALLASALGAHPAVLQLAARERAAEARADAARGGRWPTVQARFGLGRSVNAEGFGALDEFNPPGRTFSFDVQASVPLFDRFATSARVAQADAERSAAAETLRERQLEVERQVRSALVDLRSRYAAVMLAERSAALTAERLEMAQEQYRMGAVGFTELQQVTEQAAAAERATLQARWDFASAVVALEELVGRTLRP